MKKSESWLDLEVLTALSNRLSMELGHEYGENEYYAWNNGVNHLSWWGRVNIKEVPAGADHVAAEIAAHCGNKEFPKSVTFAMESVYPGFTEDLAKNGMYESKTRKGMLYVFNEHTPEEEAKIVGPRGAAKDGKVIVVSRDRVAEYAATSDTGFARPTPTLDTMEVLFRLEHPVFLGYEIDGKLVATTIYYTEPGMDNAGIYDVATLPEYRGCGIASALVGECIRRGRESGLSLISLQASVFGEPVYRGLGFRVVSDIRMYDCEVSG